ncbi:MAG: DUF456 domain-containing protein [Bacteroidales bacterium]|nr:DUF456 domain-containing protein [Bacteroidales bacterium]
MDIFLIILGGFFILIGLAGCIVPIVPGPPLSYFGILLLHWTEKVQFDQKFLITWALLATGVTLVDFMVPIWGTKKFGGTKRGTWGATIGLILGLFFFPPIGIILGPFIGAVAGELTHSEDLKKAIRSGMGSLLGFLLGTGLKFAVSGFLIYYFFKEAF